MTVPETPPPTLLAVSSTNRATGHPFGKVSNRRRLADLNSQSGGHRHELFPAVGDRRLADLPNTRELFRWTVLLALITSLFTFSQLVSPSIWALLTGEGPYQQPVLAGLGIFVFVAGIVVTAVCPRGGFQSANEAPFVLWSRRVASVVSLTIAYPVLYHYYYDIPQYVFVVLTALTLLFAAATWMSLRWIVILNLLVSISVGSFLNVPPYLWDITDLRHTLNALNLLSALAVVICGTAIRYRRTSAPKRAVKCFLPQELVDSALLLLGLAFVTPYFFAAAGKIWVSSEHFWLLDGVSWIWRERLDKFFELFYYFGYTWLSPPITPELVGSVLAWPAVRIGACAIVLFGELAIMGLLLSRRMFLAGLVGCQLLHLGFTFLAGTYFIHWFVWNIVLALLLTATQHRRYVQSLSITARAFITSAAWFLVPIVFHSCVLAWGTDRSRLEVYVWHKGKSFESFSGADWLFGVTRINPNHFFPYEKNFQMAWRFDRPPRATADNGSRASQALAHRFLAHLMRWYKLRAVGEWHEHLKREVSYDEQRVAAERLITRWERRRQLGDQPSFPYYTHIMANKRWFTSLGAAESPPTANSVILAKVVLEDRGVFRSEHVNTQAVLRVDLDRSSPIVYVGPDRS